MPATPPEAKKPRISNRTLIVIATILGASIVVLYFIIFMPLTIPFGNHEYKISLTHNGQPISNVDSSIIPSITYGMTLYNKSSYCGNDYVEETVSSNKEMFTFSSSTQINGRTISDYQSNYAFEPYSVFQTIQADSLIYVQAISNNYFDGTSNYDDLPKLSNSYATTFDVPIFDVSSFTSSSTNNTAIIITYKMIDNWQYDGKFYCRLSKVYSQTTDGSLSECPAKIADFYATQKLCTRSVTDICGVNQQAFYAVPATIAGNTITCSLPSSDLTKGNTYSVSIIVLKQSAEKLYTQIIAKNVGTIDVVSA